VKLDPQVDPAQTRTIGVVTKIDTIQKDSDIVLKLRAERPSDIKLELGWIAVRCRTPTEVKDGLGAKELLQQEKLFFRTNPLLADLEPRFWGTSTLVSRVVDIQSQTIDKWLPEVRSKIHEALFSRKSKLRQAPETCEDDNAKRLIYNKLINKFVTTVENCLRGEYGIYRQEKNLHIPPRMYEFLMAFRKTTEENYQDFLSPEYTTIIEERDAENQGVGLPNFLSDPVFRALFVAEFEKVMPRAVQQLLQDVRDYMLSVLTRFVGDSMVDFPRLVSSVQADVQRIVHSAHENARGLLDAVLESEIACVLTLDEPGYEKLLNEMREFAEDDNSIKDQIKNMFHCSVFGIGSDQILAIRTTMKDKPRVFHMQTSLAAYSTMMRRQILDRVAKLSKLCFEVHLQAQVRESLMMKEIEFIRSHMLQDPKLALERKYIENSIRRLEACLSALETL